MAFGVGTGDWGDNEAFSNWFPGEEFNVEKISDTTVCKDTGQPHSLTDKIHKYKLPKNLKWCKECGAIIMEKDGLVALPYRDIK